MISTNETLSSQPNGTPRTPGVKLASPPTLDEAHFRTRKVRTENGIVEALLPVTAEFRCKREKAPSLVLIPGLGMDALGFVRQLQLGPHAHLHFVQTPNEPARGEEGLHVYARYVEDYILERKLDRRRGGLILGGCSMGGALSIAIALRGRVKLRGLVLIGTFGSSKHLPAWQRFCAPLAWVLPMGLARQAAWQMVARSRMFGTVTPLEASWLVSNKARRNQRYFGTAVKVLTQMDQIEAARKLKLPTIVLHGTRDIVLPHAAGVELAETIPGARLVTIHDSGHALFFTDYEQVNSAIAEFITGLSA
jgi:pimeloyl-ACP methyl ester carboxylesterase